jgi:hypothetical protein
LKQIDKIPEAPQTSSMNKHNATLPRVQQAPQNILSPRVQSAHKTKIPTVSPSAPSVGAKFKEHATSTKPQHKNANSPYNNSYQHRYNLRSLHRTTPRSYKARAAEYLVAQQLFEEYNHQINHIYNINGKRQTIDTVCKGLDKDIWNQSISNEWGRLAQGNDSGVHFNDVIDFISQQEVPRDRDVTYATYVLDYRPLNSQAHIIRITVGGDKLSYPDDAGSPAANILETKKLINSVISDAKTGARFMSADAKVFFLNSPMQRPEYMKVSYDHIPEDIKRKYNLASKVTQSGHLYIKIKKGCMV